MLRAVVVGDSSMWGQGLAQKDKYAFKYIKWLQNNGYQITLSPEDFYAHSGAIIGDLSHDATSDKMFISESDTSNINHYKKYYHEVPTSYPTVYKQVLDIPDPLSVDILIMNGGINDVRMDSAVEIDNDDFRNKVHKNIFQVTNKRIPAILKKTTQLLPNAQIIYVGYYPAVCEESEIPIEYRLLIYQASMTFFSFLGPIAFAITESKIEDIKRQAMELFELFHLGASHQIAQFNKEHGQNVLCCPSGYGTENAIFSAGPQYVFGPGDQRDLNVEQGRKQYCKKVIDGIADGSIEEIEEVSPLCDQAYLLHPNKEGSIKYVEQLIKIATPVIRFSLRDAINNISSNTLSVRQTTAKLIDFNVKSLRQLIDLKWINAVTVMLDLNIQAAPSNMSFPDQIDFDFGWGKKRIFFRYKGKGMRYSRMGLLNVKGDRSLKEFKKVQLWFPKLRDSIRFKLNLEVFINGYIIKKVEIIESSFVNDRDLITWQTNI